MEQQTRRELLIAIPSVLICATLPKWALAGQVNTMAEYQAKLEAYTHAHDAYERIAGPYWSHVGEMRRARIRRSHSGTHFTLDDYVLTQPPVYAGIPKPIDPSQRERAHEEYTIPVVADFLASAARYFDFVPHRPRNENEYKRAYATAARAAGLTKEQIVRIYGFESGGDGKYDVQAGLEYPHSGAHAISTALGYNQLLLADTIELLSEFGDEFVGALRAKLAERSGEATKVLERKIEKLREMITFCRSVPSIWDAHVALGKTEKGRGIQALILDIDIGPILQVRRLTSYIAYARARGHDGPLSAAELEMMNLSGAGNGLDMIIMEAGMRHVVPTSNYFERGGYERNPVVSRNNVVAKLLDATNSVMDEEVKLQGARDLASFF